MKRFNCEPDDELYDDDINDADEEYPREDGESTSVRSSGNTQINLYATEHLITKPSSPRVLSGRTKQRKSSRQIQCHRMMKTSCQKKVRNETHRNHQAVQQGHHLGQPRACTHCVRDEHRPQEPRRHRNVDLVAGDKPNHNERSNRVSHRETARR